MRPLLDEIFYWVLNMSIMGTFAGLIVLLVRKVRALPRFAAYLLWLIPAIRFWVPFGWASKYSLMNIISGLASRSVRLYREQPLSEFTYTNFVMAAEDYFPIEYKTKQLESVFELVSVVWLIMALAALMAFIFFYGRAKREIGDVIPLGQNQYLSHKVHSPVVYGIIKPRIILPEGIRNEDLPYILQHERIHIRRLDNLWRVLAIATACIHWFNPLIWLMLKAFFADMELSCDEKVIKRLEPQEQKAYALALVNCEVHKSMLASAFGGAGLKTRIEKILSYKRMTVLSSFCFLLFILWLAVVLLTNTAV